MYKNRSFRYFVFLSLFLNILTFNWRGQLKRDKPTMEKYIMMKQLALAIATCVLTVTSVNAQINDNFFNDTNGTTNFTLSDATGFSALFGAPGEVVFFANGSLYNGSNRAFGVAAGQTSVISFNQAANVSVDVLDTDQQTANGGTVPSGTVLTLADGTITGFDAAGASVGTFTIGQSGFSNFTFGAPVTSLQLSNAGEAGSFSLLGSISATAAVPEPSCCFLMTSLAGLVSMRRRRRS